MSNDRLLKKGFYDHQQEYSFLYVRQYMFTEQNGKKCLHLRFFNESNVRITALEMVLTQIDSKGKVIAKDRIKLENIFAEPGEMYAPKKTVAVEPACSDFTVKIISVYSNKYRYTFRRGRAVEHYDPRGYNRAGKKRRRESDVKKQPRYENYGKFYRLITFVSIMLIGAACVLSVMYGMGAFDGLSEFFKSFLF